MIEVLQNIKQKFLILKPGKGQAIVVIDKTDYYNSMERLFNDTSRFTLYMKTQHYVIYQLCKLILIYYIKEIK